MSVNSIIEERTMKTWQIYTFMILGLCMIGLQLGILHGQKNVKPPVCDDSTLRNILKTLKVIMPSKDEQEIRKKEQEIRKRAVDDNLYRPVSNVYYWKSIPKDELSERNALLEMVRQTKDDPSVSSKGDKVYKKLHFLIDPLLYEDEEYVGTLYETEDEVIIATKKKEETYLKPEGVWQDT